MKHWVLMNLEILDHSLNISRILLLDNLIRILILLVLLQLNGPTPADPNKVLREYKLIGAWPTSVGAINLAYDSNDQIEEFDVEFQYQYLDAGEKNFAQGQGEFTTLRRVGSTTAG